MLRQRTMLAVVATLLVALAPTSRAADPRLLDVVHGPWGTLGVEGSRSLTAGELYFGLALTYADDEVVSRSAPPSRPLDARTLSELAVAWGITDYLRIGVVLPAYLHQASAYLDKDAEAGIGDPRLIPKLTLIGDDTLFGLGLGLIAPLTIPLGGPEYMGQKTVTVTPTGLLDYRFESGVTLMLNLGLRIRGADRLDGADYGQELRAGLGVEVPTGARGLALTAEALAGVVFGEAEGDGASFDSRFTPAELGVGLRWRLPFGLDLRAGMGMGLTDGYGAADYRATLAIGQGFGGSGPEGDYWARFAPASPPEPEAPPEPEETAAEEEEAPAPPPRPTMDAAVFASLVANDPDPDVDGVVAAADGCPQEPEDHDGFQDADGCPDPDNDRDGIADEDDRCPNEREVVNGVEDEDGCPDEGEGIVALSPDKLVIKEQVRFRTASSELAQSSIPLLKQVARFLKTYWYIKEVLIEGHTDNLGNEDWNVNLSEQRAQRVASFLMDEGVDPARLAAKGVGPTRPIADNNTEEGRAANRRVEFRIVKTVNPYDPGAR